MRTPHTYPKFIPAIPDMARLRNYSPYLLTSKGCFQNLLVSQPNHPDVNSNNFCFLFLLLYFDDLSLNVSKSDPMHSILKITDNKMENKFFQCSLWLCTHFSQLSDPLTKLDTHTGIWLFPFPTSKEALSRSQLSMLLKYFYIIIKSSPLFLSLLQGDYFPPPPPGCQNHKIITQNLYYL